MMPEKLKWLTGALGDKTFIAAIAALIIAIGGQVVSFRQDSRIEYRELASEYREEVTRLRSVERMCLEMELSLNRRMDDLRGKLILLESGTQDLPFPHWLKSNGTESSPGIMMALNRAYEDRFLIPYGKTADDYIGKTDAQFWGDKIGGQYWSADLTVIRTKSPVDKKEVDPFNTKDSIRVIKYPRTLGGRVIGIGGMALPDIE